MSLPRGVPNHTPAANITTLPVEVKKEIDSLPFELILTIFEKLNGTALANACRVCRQWRCIILSSDSLRERIAWQILANSDLDKETSPPSLIARFTRSFDLQPGLLRSLEIAKAHWQLGNREKTGDLLKRAATLAQKEPPSDEKESLLKRIASMQAEAGFIEEALLTFKAINSPLEKTFASMSITAAQITIAKAEYKKGNKKGANQRLEATLVFIQRTEGKDQNLAKIATAQAEIGEFQKGEETLRSIKNDYYYNIALREIAVSLSDSGIIALAEHVTTCISMSDQKNPALQALGLAQVRVGQLRKAQVTCEAIKAPRLKDAVLEAMALAQIKIHQWEGLEQIYEEILDFSLKHRVLQVIITSQIEAKEYSFAVHWLKKEIYCVSKEALLNKLTKSQVVDGKIKEAMQLFSKTETPAFNAQALSALAFAMAKAKENEEEKAEAYTLFTRAKQWARKGKGSATKNEVFESISLAEVRACFTQAKRWVRKIECRETRNEVFESISLAEAKAGLSRSVKKKNDPTLRLVALDQVERKDFHGARKTITLSNCIARIEVLGAIAIAQVKDQRREEADQTFKEAEHIASKNFENERAVAKLANAFLTVGHLSQAFDLLLKFSTLAAKRAQTRIIQQLIKKEEYKQAYEFCKKLPGGKGKELQKQVAIAQTEAFLSLKMAEFSEI
ncbi:MAG: hypothetical protein S4CHLAM45_01480 [Chlamydiales bacterium]|nr:hypothetical protein [Chlamydiales bacterium]MCH9619468.1 hypothetical protein [Chlamydiales bacterium]MCH9622272.1 hypothetical protein [Chlamydiales bacterium]